MGPGEDIMVFGFTGWDVSRETELLLADSPGACPAFEPDLGSGGGGMGGGLAMGNG